MKTNKSAVIREILTAARGPLTVTQLQPLVERKMQASISMKKLSDLCYALKANGEATYTGHGDTREYTIAKGLPAPQPKTLGSIARKYAEPAALEPPITMAPSAASGKLTMLVIELKGVDAQVVSAAFDAVKQALMQGAA